MNLIKLNFLLKIIATIVHRARLFRHFTSIAARFLFLFHQLGANQGIHAIMQMHGEPGRSTEVEENHYEKEYLFHALQNYGNKSQKQSKLFATKKGTSNEAPLPTY